ncbi:uncharacterized protein LOC110867529 [Helianthus annuus]|uniref:uncharacterized protein LOC110867529 n=1 Tax=Helianthus annuus TaxID=4232 RepID=UPI001652C48F|nr:uncharacterized protein LOC110867529 [Helianthus annuus]
MDPYQLVLILLRDGKWNDEDIIPANACLLDGEPLKIVEGSISWPTQFLESFGIATISHHSLLFSRTALVQPVEVEELTRHCRYLQARFSFGSSPRANLSKIFNNPEPDGCRYRSTRLGFFDHNGYQMGT